MTEDDDEPRGLAAALRARAGILIAIAGMAAWLALIWFMVGDVL